MLNSATPPPVQTRAPPNAFSPNAILPQAEVAAPNAFFPNATLQAPATGESFNRQTGTLVINVFSPAGVGACANLTIGERIKDKFDRAKFSSIIFDPCSGLATIQPAEQEAFYQTQFSATFDAYLD